MKGKILIVEDEAAIREMLGYTLMKNAYAFEEAADVDQAQEIISRDKPDLILLDWMLPGVSGVDYARRLRNNPETKSIPIIMLTARSDETDKVRALDIGADDYITKPFSTKELLARIRAVLRRSDQDKAQGLIQVEGLTLDPETYRVTANEETIEISPTEFRLLQFFITHPERVYSRTQLLDQVWGQNVYVEERTVDVHIRRLRQTLAPYNYDKFIQTVRSVGYRFSSK
ncbi:MAG: phosphate regulon transcriptional regulator PhoB [Gammaproteobacteria bacterium]|jgi:two-component system, OmpR family, phosphate regulon response regulator PhoB|nr:phosphate regulon transcriptional regulator PhoB [Gammaproteobacteria bacterium]